jgi:hypothetical protein
MLGTLLGMISRSTPVSVRELNDFITLKRESASERRALTVQRVCSILAGRTLDILSKDWVESHHI